MEGFPALAVAGSVIMPTESDSKGSTTIPFSIVHNYGVTFRGIASANVNLLLLNNYVFGLVAVAGLFFRDLSQQEEVHGFYWAGFLLPIDFFQLLLEVNGTVKDQSTQQRTWSSLHPACGL